MLKSDPCVAQLCTRRILIITSQHFKGVNAAVVGAMTDWAVTTAKAAVDRNTKKVQASNLPVAVMVSSWGNILVLATIPNSDAKL